jgi:hypothetical protein
VKSIPSSFCDENAGTISTIAALAGGFQDFIEDKEIGRALCAAIGG